MKFIIAIFFAIIIFACEDTIDPNLDSADPVLVIDAWINNKNEDQKIIITKTQPYFENENPTGVSGAIVIVTDNNGKIFSFIEDANQPGYYIWKPTVDETFGTIGNSYELSILVENQTLEASSYMGPVPAIDSITFKEEEDIGTNDIIYIGEFWATDIDGLGNTYWIKTYKNSVLLNKPSEINTAFDAGFSSGSALDGVTFIAPIREGISPSETDEDDNTISPFQIGDSVNVQIHSITVESFNYLAEVVTQTDRPGGFGELFSSPLSNVSTNIVNTNTDGASVVGFFNVSAVSTLGKKFESL